MKIHFSTAWRIFFSIVLAFGMAGMPAHSARANGLCTVTTDSDDPVSVPVGSLREKILASSCLTIEFDGNHTINLAGVLPDLDRNLTITGGTHTVIVDGGGGGGMRIFKIASLVSVTLDHLTIRNGRVGSVAGGGGGIYNAGSLTVTNVIFSANQATIDTSGGAIYNDIGASLQVTDSSFTGNTAANDGGAIDNLATAQVESSTFSNNQAGLDGGAIANYSGNLQVQTSTFTLNQASGAGGAIYGSNGSLRVTNSTLQGNTAVTYGGGISHEGGDLWVLNSTLSGNSVASGGGNVGGGIANIFADTFSLVNTIIANSTFGGDCFSQGTTTFTGLNNLVKDGSISCQGVQSLTGDPQLAALANNGGLTQTMALMPLSQAINNGDPTACPSTDQRGLPRVGTCDIGAYELQTLSCTVTSNLDGTAPIPPGSLREKVSAAYCSTIDFDGDHTITLVGAQLNLNRDLTITGGEHNIFISGGGPGGVRIFNIASTAHVTLEHLTIQNGRANAGAGIYNAGNLVARNITLSGNAAVAQAGGIYNSGTLTISNSTLSGNSAARSGGGIKNDGTLTLRNSTLSGNSVSDTDSGAGGAIFNWSMMTITGSTFTGNIGRNAGGAIYSEGTLIVANSTLNGNSVTAGYGGGIDNTGNLTMVNSTLFGNSASVGGGNLSILGETISLANNIIAGATSGEDCFKLFGTINQDLNNLVRTGNCSATFTGDLLLGPLQNNGGPTQTMALLPGSPAIDAGDDATCAAAPVNNLDQREATRPQGAHCDIGAYEYIDPTDVSLASFTALVEKKPATRDGISVLLSWETTSEVDNLGFNLYRAILLDGARVKLNAGLIPTLVPPGSPFGAVYHYTDTGLMEGKTYYYWLETVDIHGGKELAGPVLVKLVAGKSK